MNYLNIINGIWQNARKDKILEYIADLPTPSSYLATSIAILVFASAAESAFDSSNYLPMACVVGSAAFMGITGAARYWVHRQVEEFKNELRAPPEDKNRAAFTLVRMSNEERATLIQQTNNLNIPDEQRLNALRSLATCPSEQWEEIVNQANNLHIPDEQRLDALRSLATYPSEQWEEIVNQANNLHIPDEQRLDALHSLATCPSEQWEEIVNQANNLNIPDEQRFDALNHLIALPQRADIVNQANNLNIPQERRLILFTHLCELGQERHEFMQKIQQIQIADPVILAAAIETLRLVPLDQRIALLNQAARLISAEMNGPEKLTILQSLVGVPDVDERLRFVGLLEGHLQVHPQSIFSHGNHSKIAIITAFFQIPNTEKLATIQRMSVLARIFRDRLGIETPNVLTMLEIARNVPDDQLQELIAYGKSFTNMFTNSRQKLEVLQYLSRVPRAYRHGIENFMNFRMSQSERIEILEICARIPENCFDCVMQKFSNLIDITTKFKDRKQLIMALAKIPSRSWIQFHALLPGEQERVLSNLADIPDDFAETFIELTPEDRTQFLQMSAAHKEVFINTNAAGRELFLRMPIQRRAFFTNMTPARRNLFITLSEPQREAFIIQMNVQERNTFMETTPQVRQIFIDMTHEQRQAFIAMAPEEQNFLANMDNPDHRDTFTNMTRDQRQIYRDLSPQAKEVFISLKPNMRQRFVSMSPAERNAFITIWSSLQ